MTPASVTRNAWACFQAIQAGRPQGGTPERERGWASHVCEVGVAIQSIRGGVTRITVYVQPRAAKTELAGLHDGVPRIRLAAPPVDGAANAALVEFIAERLSVAKRSVRVVSGLSSRRKVVEIHGVSFESVAAALGSK